MPELSVPIGLKKAITPLLTRKLFFGAAISCAVGLGLGVWLQPPKFYYGAATPTVTLPQDQPNPWVQAAEAAPMPAGQTVTDPNAAQAAAVSPPAGGQPMQVAQQADASTVSFDRTQVAASGDASQAQQDPQGPTQAVYAQAEGGWDTRADRNRYRNRDWASYSARDRDNEDYLDSPPPPRDGPPDQRPPMQDRRWDVRPDGPAVPVDDQDNGGG